MTVAGREFSAADVKDADALIVRSVTKVNEDLLRKSRVSFVGSCTIGFDHIDLSYLERKGICFASAPGSNAISAAEYVISALVVLQQKYEWDLKQKKVAIVGVGNVGGAVYERMQILGIECLLYDPPRQEQLADRDYVSWDRVKEADIITAHVPLTRDGPYPTLHMFNEDFFRSLKQGATFINTARGLAVDEVALKSISSERPDLHLVLDVWQNEPDIDMDLLNRTDIATPHIAGYSYDGKLLGTRMIYEALCQHLAVTPDWQDPSSSNSIDNIILNKADCQNQEAAIFRAVTDAYDVRNDDARMREIQNLPEQERGPYFDSLRKNYPLRREFSCHTIELKERIDIDEVLEGLGFTVIKR